MSESVTFLAYPVLIECLVRRRGKGGVEGKGEREDRREGEGIRGRERDGNRSLVRCASGVVISIRAPSVNIRGSNTLLILLV